MPHSWKYSRPACGFEKPNLVEGIPAHGGEGVGTRRSLRGLFQPTSFYDFMTFSPIFKEKNCPWRLDSYGVKLNFQKISKSL